MRSDQDCHAVHRFDHASGVNLGKRMYIMSLLKYRPVGIHPNGYE